MASFVSTASSTAKSGQPHPDLAKQCRDRMIPIILHATNEATASAIRSPNSVVSGLRGNDLLLQARQQQLPFSQGQPQIGDLNKIIGPVDRHDVDGLFLTLGPGFHQPHNPSHALTSDPRSRREATASAPAPPISRQSRTASRYRGSAGANSQSLAGL